MFGKMLNFTDENYVRKSKYKEISSESALKLQHILPEDIQCELQTSSLQGDKEDLLYIGQFKMPIEFTKRFKIEHLPLEVNINKNTGKVSLFVNAIKFVPYFEDEIKFAQNYFIKEKIELDKIDASIDKKLIKFLVSSM